jgi:hypothetical protein
MQSALAGTIVSANVTRTPFILALLLAACCSVPAGAEPAVTFPLGDYYRVGRYMPVQPILRPGKAFSLSASGAVGAERYGGNMPVPLLAVGPLADVRLALGERIVEQPVPQLRALRPDQRLVGIATDAEDAGRLLRELFPAKAIVRTPLDRVDPFPGPALAWTGLDAVLLDPSTAARVSTEQLMTLRAGGVAVAIRVEVRPAGDWPWQRRGAWWVLPPDESAAVDVVQPDRYTPSGDLAGAPAWSRQVVVALLTCFALAAVGLSLWRSRRAWMAVVALALVAAGGMWFWNLAQPRSAARAIKESSGEWIDRYTLHVARADGDIRHAIVPEAAAAWPILFSPNHAREAHLALECREDGAPERFVAYLKRGQSLVILERIPKPATPSPSPATAPAARTR